MNVNFVKIYQFDQRNVQRSWSSSFIICLTLPVSHYGVLRNVIVGFERVVLLLISVPVDTAHITVLVVPVPNDTVQNVFSVVRGGLAAGPCRVQLGIIQPWYFQLAGKVSMSWAFQLYGCWGERDSVDGDSVLDVVFVGRDGIPCCWKYSEGSDCLRHVVRPWRFCQPFCHVLRRFSGPVQVYVLPIHKLGGRLNVVVEVLLLYRLGDR